MDLCVNEAKRMRDIRGFKAQMAIEAIRRDLTLAEQAAKHCAHPKIVAMKKWQVILQRQPRTTSFDLASWRGKGLTIDWVVSQFGAVARKPSHSQRSVTPQGSWNVRKDGGDGGRECFPSISQ
jgi:hypothetical protein